MDETRTLAAFGATTAFADLPDAVVGLARQLLADQLACQLNAADLPWSRAVLDAAAGLAGGGPATVVRHGTHLPVDEAAFVNGAFGHGNEVDDAHIAVRTHPGAVIVPSALATAEAVGGATGRDVLAAIAVGAEVMLRVAYASMPALMDERHHNTPSTAGPFGAAVAAGRLLGLAPEAFEPALGIAAYQSSGLMQYTVAGGSVKRIQTSIGAKSGVRAAYLAAAGLTSPAEILEGKRAFLAAFAGDFDASRLTDGLGRDYLLLGTCFKRFNVKYRIHASIDGLVELLARHHLSGADLAGIEVGVTEATRELVGITAEPSDPVSAQLSLRFALAATALRGPGLLGSLGSADLADPEILDLARRVEVVREPALEAESGGNWGCVLTLTTRGGQREQLRVPAPRGSPENPMSSSEVAEKFHRFADPVLGEERAVQVLAVIDGLEEYEPARDLLPLLCPPATRRLAG